MAKPLRSHCSMLGQRLLITEVMRPLVISQVFFFHSSNNKWYNQMECYVTLSNPEAGETVVTPLKRDCNAGKVPIRSKCFIATPTPGKKMSILFYPITLQGRWGTKDDFATISFQAVLFSAVLVELAKSILVNMSSHIFYPPPPFSSHCVISNHLCLAWDVAKQL